VPSFDLRGARIEYLERGAGEPVVLLHCSASSSEQWRALMESLADRYHVLARDLYGYGRTSPWRGSGFSLAHEVEIALAMAHRAGGRAAGRAEGYLGGGGARRGGARRGRARARHGRIRRLLGRSRYVGRRPAGESRRPGRAAHLREQSFQFAA